MACAEKNHTCTQPKGFEDEFSGNSSTAHDTDCSYAGWVVTSANACKVCACVTAPVAEDGKDFFFRLIFKRRSDLSYDLCVGEVHLGDGVLGAFGYACSAAVAACSNYLCWFW